MICCAHWTIRRCLPLLLAVCAAGLLCASQQATGSGSTRAQAGQDPQLVDVPSSTYEIAAGNLLHISLWKEPQFIETATVRPADMRVNWNGQENTDPQTKQTYQGMFGGLSFDVRAYSGFSEEAEIRRFNIADTPNNDRTIAVFTLLWCPGPGSEGKSAALP
jgi:hypothetical protein